MRDIEKALAFQRGCWAQPMCISRRDVYPLPPPRHPPPPRHGHDHCPDHSPQPNGNNHRLVTAAAVEFCAACFGNRCDWDRADAHGQNDCPVRHSRQRHPRAMDAAAETGRARNLSPRPQSDDHRRVLRFARRKHFIRLGLVALFVCRFRAAQRGLHPSCRRAGAGAPVWGRLRALQNKRAAMDTKSQGLGWRELISGATPSLKTR